MLVRHYLGDRMDKMDGSRKWTPIKINYGLNYSLYYFHRPYVQGYVSVVYI
jgi:hypothetical protein